MVPGERTSSNDNVHLLETLGQFIVVAHLLLVLYDVWKSFLLLGEFGTKQQGRECGKRKGSSTTSTLNMSVAKCIAEDDKTTTPHSCSCLPSLTHLYLIASRLA